MSNCRVPVIGQRRPGPKGDKGDNALYNPPESAFVPSFIGGYAVNPASLAGAVGVRHTFTLPGLAYVSGGVPRFILEFRMSSISYAYKVMFGMYAGPTTPAFDFNAITDGVSNGTATYSGSDLVLTFDTTPNDNFFRVNVYNDRLNFGTITSLTYTAVRFT